MNDKRETRERERGVRSGESTNGCEKARWNERKRVASSARGEHGVRFSDKISNLKFHRNFTILGSKLIVLSTGTFNHPRRRPTVLRPYRVPLCRFLPSAIVLLVSGLTAKGTLKISSLLLITRHAYRRGLRDVPKGLFGGRITTSTLIYKVSEI